MTDRRRKSIVYGICVVAIIWGVWNNPFTAEKKTESDTSNSIDPGGGSTLTAAIVPSKATTTASLDAMEWKGDPFVRQSAPKRSSGKIAERQSKMRLSAIATSGSGTMAIVNGQMVKQSGSVDGWTVASIDDNSVLLKKGSESMKLTLRRR